MSIDEFQRFGFMSGDKAEYEGVSYPIASVDFVESLIGILGEISNAPDDITWKRCENCEVLR